jgi:hypothetical protein
MPDDGGQTRPRLNTILSFRLSSNKKTFLLLSIIIFALILDTSLGNLGNLVSTSFSAWKAYLYLSISVIFIVGQFFILRFLNQKNLARRTKTRLNFNILFKIVSIVQYAFAGILLITIMQMVFTSYYSVIILVVNVMPSYILAISMMVLLTQRFFSWFRSKRNIVILLYGLASATIAIELGLTLVITNALFESINRTVAGAGLISMSPVYPASIASLMNSVNSFYIIFSIASFIMTWVATALLLRHYSLKLGKVRYWTVVSLPLLYFLFQFVAFTLNANLLLLSGNSIFFSILVTLIFTLSKPVGGILFGVAFWTMAKDVSANKVVREYLIIAGFGLLTLFISDQAITLIAIPYPPFGLVTISFLGLSSYMILVGIFSSAISVAEDSNLRKSIRDFTLGQSRLLDSIGSAQMEQEIERKVLVFTKQVQERMVEETGVEPSLTEDETKQYLEQVIREVKKQKASANKNHNGNG